MENLLWWQQNMINKELYDLVTKVDKKAAKNVCGCGTCFCELIKENIENSISLNKAFVNWKNENKVYTIEGNTGEPGLVREKTRNINSDEIVAYGSWYK